MKIINDIINRILAISTTNFVVLMFSVAAIAFTAKGIMQVSDFLPYMTLILGYKFGKSQPDTVVTETTSIEDIENLG